MRDILSDNLKGDIFWDKKAIIGFLLFVCVEGIEYILNMRGTTNDSKKYLKIMWLTLTTQNLIRKQEIDKSHTRLMTILGYSNKVFKLEPLKWFTELVPMIRIST